MQPNTSISPANQSHTTSSCHCGGTAPFETCCEPLINGTVIANSPEQLMRSRFTAFKLRHHDYIMNTQQLGQSYSMDKKDFDLNIDWLGLMVLATPSQNQVEFTAFFTQKSNQALQQLHELSDFKQIEGRWFYCHGKPLPAIKVPRNSRCFCLSGKKYKKCHAQTGL